MLWYGFIFYFIVFIFIFILIFIWNRLFSLYIFFNSFFLFNYLLFLFSFIVLFNLLYIYYFISKTFLFYSSYSSFFFFFDFKCINYFLLISSSLSSILLPYFIPFMYIFFFITILAIFYCLSYNYSEIFAFSNFCFIIISAGLILFFTDSLALFFFSYEMLLLPSFFILFKYAKTRRCIEAAYLMFFWTQFGAFFLLFAFLYLFFLTGSSSFTIISFFNFSNFETNFFCCCWFIGFGVKLPIWPFYGWLPKAHVEASTNFSIFLSGVLVKFAFFGLLKCLLTIQLEPTCFFIFPFLFIGLTDSIFKLFYQIDLKKLVAYSTVVEMHWLTICIISGESCLFLSGFCMLISHAFLSTNAFFLVDSINRRFKTRLITELNGLNFLCPKLFLFSLINCLIFLGFPGSIFFVSELLFFVFLFDLFPILSIFLFILLYLFAPSFFFRSWLNLLFGSSIFFFKRAPLDLNSKEVLLFSFLTFIIFWFGFTWHIFLI